MTAFDWSGMAFVANPGNVPLTALPPWITTLAIQVAWGTQPQDIGDFPERCLGRYYVAAWAWCQGDDVEAEAELHGRLALGYVAFIANTEDPYDAHGDSGNPRYKMAERYLAALPWDGPLGITTTPQFGSDLTAWQKRGAVYMPQAFTLENGATVAAAVQHGNSWGWPTEQQRPLAQAYTTGGVRPSGSIMDADADALGVGLVPYVIEQATDPGGQTWLNDTRRSVERATVVPTDSGGSGGTVSNWWESAYRGGPMVKVDGFPRPLYPPDAAAKGKRPSMDGPDVLAYKRTVMRAGRWPDQAFDDSFSNAFSHGKSGNVRETGIAGVQRQQHIEATGWIGEKTFNTLRSIRIPDGLPDAGDMAMDAEAVELVNQAWSLFKGAEPAPPPTETIRERALATAVGQVGYAESPAGSNLTKFGDWYGMNGEPWCAIFVTWAFEQIGSASFKKGTNYAYCPYVVADARANRNGLTTTDDPIPGDLVVYDWQRDTVYDHIGIVEKVKGGGTFTAIEGNTSTSNNSNGGQVMRRDRSTADASIVFVRVKEAA